MNELDKAYKEYLRSHAYEKYSDGTLVFFGYSPKSKKEFLMDLLINCGGSL